MNGMLGALAAEREARKRAHENATPAAAVKTARRESPSAPSNSTPWSVDLTSEDEADTCAGDEALARRLQANEARAGAQTATVGVFS